MTIEYTLETVKQHNKPDDLWLVINNKVYDVTKYLKEHPGGEDELTDNAGTDATEAFTAVGHSNEAKQILQKFYIGDLAKSDIPKTLSCRQIAIGIGAVALGIGLVYLIRRGLAHN